MSDQIALNCMLNVEAVPASEGPRLVYLLVDIRPGLNSQPLEAPVNMAIVLDVSESMRLPVLSQEQFQELSAAGHVQQTISDGVPVWTFKEIPERIRSAAPGDGMNGRASYYIEKRQGRGLGYQEHLASMVFEGLFERYPTLKVVFVEGGYTWLIPFLWRMDADWKALGREVPWVKKAPSE